MIFQAALGIMTGISLAVTLAGFRPAPSWSRVATLVAGIGIALFAALLIGDLFVNPGGPSRSAVAFTAIGLGGVAAAILDRKLRAGSRPPGTAMLISSLFFLYATLTVTGNDKASLIATVLPIFLFACIPTLMAVHQASFEWRRTAYRFGGIARWWFGLLTFAAAAGVLNSLIEQGTWLDTSPSAVWLFAAWIVAGAGLLVGPGRPRAALLLAAAVATVLTALAL